MPNSSSSNQDTVTLAIPAENFRTLDVWLLFYKDADTGCAAHVSFPTNIMSYTPREASNAYIGFVPNASAGDATSISVYELSGTTLTIAARKVSIVRVVGER